MSKVVMRALVQVAAGICKIVLIWRGSPLNCFFLLGREKVVQGIAREIPREGCSAVSCTILLVAAFPCRHLMIPAYVLLAPNCRSKEWKVFKGEVLVGVDSRSAAVTFPELTMKAEISLYKEPGIFKLRLSFSTDFVAFNFMFCCCECGICTIAQSVAYMENPYRGNSLDLLNEVQPVLNTWLFNSIYPFCGVNA